MIHIQKLRQTANLTQLQVAEKLMLLRIPLRNGKQVLHFQEHPFCQHWLTYFIALLTTCMGEKRSDFIGKTIHTTL